MLDQEILIRSEVLEPVVQKTVQDILEMFAQGEIEFEDMKIRFLTLSRFISNCGAVHCGMAFDKLMGEIFIHSDQPDKLREVLRNVVIKHEVEIILYFSFGTTLL